ncbi:unnamed protein product [Acanthoscelides obtectus]|uniref:Uncharacterized protein n=1 Tax=Acanthoscelides obtectus TaxID=200917 RepID=A0A9P0PF65_ACAOB|nr:unnamed protein product [Acanthoscelides obtectus]CAK1675794.1 hypothetical protein AOBTE_LOCUS30429 [Acanthoscelides obtectus]
MSAMWKKFHAKQSLILPHEETSRGETIYLYILWKVLCFKLPFGKTQVDAYRSQTLSVQRVWETGKGLVFIYFNPCQICACASFNLPPAFTLLR